MARNVLSVVLGLIVGMAVNMGLITLNSSVLYPMPEGVTFEDTAGFQAYLDTLPTPAFLMVMAAHLGQALVGGWVAARLSASAPVRLALIVGAITLAGGVQMLLTVKGPVWMWAEVPLYLLLALLAGRSVEAARSASGGAAIGKREA